MTAKPFVSTDELLTRLAQAPEVRSVAVLRYFVVGLGFLSLPLLLGLLVFGERPSPVSPHVRTLDKVASELFVSNSGPSEEVAVSIELSRPGSIFIDGRHLAMRSFCKTHLARGRHVLQVRFGDATVRQILDVGEKPLQVTLDAAKRGLHVRELVAPPLSPNAPSKPSARPQAGGRDEKHLPNVLRPSV